MINDETGDRLTFESLTALEAWLEAAGVALACWGRDGAKTAAALWAEVDCGEATLRDHPPRREVDIVQVMIRRDGLALLEIAQEMAGGQRRSRAIPPSEKLKGGEAPLAAARRCLVEELGLTLPEEGLREGAPAYRRAVDSPSYPGLPTRYRVHTIEVIDVAPLRHLPAADFWRDNAAPTDPIRRHLWGWREV